MATKKTSSRKRVGAAEKPVRKKPAASAGKQPPAPRKKKPAAAAEPGPGTGKPGAKLRAAAESAAKTPVTKTRPAAKKPGRAAAASKKAKPAAGATKTAAGATKPAAGSIKPAAPKEPPATKKADRRRPLEIQDAKRKKPAPAPAPPGSQPGAAEGEAAAAGRRSSKFNPTAVVKPLKKKRAVVHAKYKVPVGRRAASRQTGDAVAPVAVASSPPEGGYTAEQLKKVKTGLTKKQFATFREQLHEHRRQLLADVAGLNASRGHDDGDSHVPLHMADVGSENYEREFNLMLQESDHRLLKDIDEAIARIDDGTFGVCLDTCTPIGRGRLEYKPWARYGIDAARAREARAPLGGSRST